MGNNEVSPREMFNSDRQSQQNQLDSDPNAIYADNMREEKIVNILSQISPDNLLTEIEHRIRGEKKNAFTDQWEPISKDAEPISELMVSNFMSFLGSLLNQNTTMSNFSPGEINNIMGLVIQYVADDLDVNCKKYGIEGNYTEMDRIGLIVLNTVFAVLKRSQNGMEASKIFKALKVTADLDSQKKGGGLGNAMAFWNK